MGQSLQGSGLHLDFHRCESVAGLAAERSYSHGETEEASQPTCDLRGQTVNGTSLYHIGFILGLERIRA